MRSVAFCYFSLNQNFLREMFSSHCIAAIVALILHWRNCCCMKAAVMWTNPWRWPWLLSSYSCATAYILLAEEEATTIMEAERLFKQALKAGESCYRRSQQLQHHGTQYEAQHSEYSAKASYRSEAVNCSIMITQFNIMKKSSPLCFSCVCVCPFPYQDETPTYWCT